MWKKVLDAHTFGHFGFTVSKIFKKVFTTLFLDILCLTSVSRHKSGRLLPQ